VSCLFSLALLASSYALSCFPSCLGMMLLSGRCCAEICWLRFHMSNAVVSPFFGLSIGEHVIACLLILLFSDLSFAE
jgi:hypothetical protein